MAGSFSNWAELEILDHAMGEGSWAMPTTYLALCTEDPTDASTGATMVEVVDDYAYAREALAGKWSVAAAGVIENDVAISFTEATGAWGTIVAFAILDGDTHGADNIIAWGELTADKAITSGDTVQFAIGDLTITLD